MKFSNLQIGLIVLVVAGLSYWYVKRRDKQNQTFSDGGHCLNWCTDQCKIGLCGAEDCSPAQQDSMAPCINTCMIGCFSSECCTYYCNNNTGIFFGTDRSTCYDTCINDPSKFGCPTWANHP